MREEKLFFFKKKSLSFVRVRSARTRPVTSPPDNPHVRARTPPLSGRTPDRNGPDSNPPVVCVYYFRTYCKAVCGGGRGTVKDMCYEIRRAEACVD